MFSQSLAQLTSIADELKVMNSVQRKRVDQVQKSSDNNSVYTLEQHVSSAVVDVLGDSGVVIVSSRYDFEDCVGGVVGLVTGMWRGEEVVVIIEAKHDMDTRTSKAMKELKNSHAYWRTLVRAGVDGTTTTMSDAMRNDYTQLSIAENKDKRVMYAVGGPILSDATLCQLDTSFKNDHTLGDAVEWFSVQPLGGHFRAVHNGDLVF